MSQAPARAIGQHRHRAAAELDGALDLDGAFAPARTTQLFDVEIESERWEPEQEARAQLVLAGGSAGESKPPIQITGRIADPPPRSLRLVEANARRRPSRGVRERLGPRPDRIAMWALLLGLFLVLVAVTSADAAPL